MIKDANETEQPDGNAEQELQTVYITIDKLINAYSNVSRYDYFCYCVVGFWKTLYQSIKGGWKNMRFCRFINEKRVFY